MRITLTAPSVAAAAVKVAAAVAAPIVIDPAAPVSVNRAFVEKTRSIGHDIPYSTWQLVSENADGSWTIEVPDEK